MVRYFFTPQLIVLVIVRKSFTIYSTHYLDLLYLCKKTSANVKKVTILNIQIAIFILMKKIDNNNKNH